MATIKSYSDLQQSKKLAEILPLESADMYYALSEDESTSVIYFGKSQGFFDKTQVAWSLAALLEQFPYELCDDDGNSSYLQIDKEDDVYQLVYTDPYGEFGSIETDRCEHFVDACYEMMLLLHEFNLL